MMSYILVRSGEFLKKMDPMDSEKAQEGFVTFPMVDFNLHKVIRNSLYFQTDHDDVWLGIRH